MMSLFVAISFRWRNLVRFAAWAIAVLASWPSRFGFLARAAVWFSGLFHRPDDLWKECLSCF